MNEEKKPEYRHRLVSFVAPGSAIVGMSVDDVERRYGVFFDEVGLPEYQSRGETIPKSEIILGEFQNFHVLGDLDELKRFTEDNRVEEVA